MKILLLDLDIINKRRAFPNLALMKLSAWHNAHGDSVYLNSPIEGYDKVYCSSVFTWNGNDKKKLATIPPEALKGGSGFHDYGWLPSEIEHTKPDYNLYPNIDSSYGFTSRGCIRHCSFCLVPEKEGQIQAWSSPYEFLDSRFNKITLFDNNILAAPNWKETMTELAKIGVEVDFNQGLDIRLLDDERIYYLKQIRVKEYRFAFDNMNYEQAVKDGIQAMLKVGIGSRKLSFYVLTHLSKDDQAIERIKLLQNYGVNVYPMIYKGADGKEPNWNYGYHEELNFHGARGNLRKFLRLAGRLS